MRTLILSVPLDDIVHAGESIALPLRISLNELVKLILHLANFVALCGLCTPKCSLPSPHTTFTTIYLGCRHDELKPIPSVRVGWLAPSIARQLNV